MNWFKKLFATNEDNNREEYEVEEQTVTPKSSRTPFRFPLIPDEEKEQFLHNEPKSEKLIEEPIKEQVKEKQVRDDQQYKPLHTHDIWLQRKQQAVVNRAPKKEVVETPIIERRKKAFTPTEVPSPVFGFSKKQENNFEELIEVEITEKDSAYEEETVPVLRERSVERVVQTVVPELIVEQEVVQVAIDQVYEEELPEVHKEVELQEKLVQSVLDETPIPAKENIRPFNVLMLKSDKEKLMEVQKVTPATYEQIDEQEVIQEGPKQLIEKELAVEHIEVESQEQPVESVVDETPVENIRPFNVLMLKSDNEKLNKVVTNMPDFQLDTIPVLEEKASLEEKTLEDKIMIESHSNGKNSPSNYVRPDFSYLLPPEMKNEDKEWMEEQAFTLIEALSHFQVSGEIVQVVQGPAVTQFELTVGPGTKVSKIRNLADDLKLALAAKDIRIQAPIPGKSSIGIEIPNRNSRAVRLSEVINTDVFLDSESPLEVALGLDLTGKPVTLDLRKMPHGLIAGATGSGKSVFINSLLVSLLYKASPDEVKLLLIDPKMVELAPFNHIPHLVSPVITDVKAATAALKWAVDEMERRYQLFAHIGVRDIIRYNSLATEKRQFAQKLPFIVIVIDELADLMMMAPTEVEDAICRIAQKARACGIHLVLATQRPSVDVITGLIKANIPTRIAFSVSSQIDSRTILDQQGAERLLGKGDMLYQGNGMSSPVRIQGTFVTDDEIENLIDYARNQGTPEYMFEQEELLQKAENVTEQDELFEEACRFIVEQGSASTSLLQRKFHLGYNRAARLIDAMYENGYITEQKGSKAREVLLTNDSLNQIFS
ncbi:DNA translocase FtsK [Psychrobacillus vulpis]|uniref:DNA translocase FtsK n=1 Tax=Psychrobacillus vulpis TaxID=2325572 RepID=UPI001F100679|nr:DNA translocase FtsK [Psychrobacillus vulpis]